MQYLLNDLIKLPLNERLKVIELAINSFSLSETDLNEDNSAIVNRIKLWKYQNLDHVKAKHDLKLI